MTGREPSHGHDSLYLARVINTVDPLRKGRLVLQVPQVLGTAKTGWANPAGPVARLPAVGSTVYVSFHGGGLELPVWWGGEPAVPSALASSTAYTDTAKAAANAYTVTTTNAAQAAANAYTDAAKTQLTNAASAATSKVFFGSIRAVASPGVSAPYGMLVNNAVIVVGQPFGVAIPFLVRVTGLVFTYQNAGLSFAMQTSVIGADARAGSVTRAVTAPNNANLSVELGLTAPCDGTTSASVSVVLTTGTSIQWYSAGLLIVAEKIQPF